MKMEENLLHLCLNKKVTLGAAESCTGGAFSYRLTLIPNISKCFLGSVIAYSNKVKHQILQVPEDLLEREGAVSEAVAIAMLEGALRTLSCDLAIATTGVAGPTPGENAEIPLGTIYVATGGKHWATQCTRLDLKGTRSQIIQLAVDYTIQALLDRLKS